MMPSRSLSCLFAPLFFILVLPIAASSDSNGAPSSPVIDAQREPRFAASVTVYEPASPLGELLKGLFARTGISLRVDRRVASYRGCVVAKEKPLEQVLLQLAEAFGFQWRRETKKDGSAVYVLYQTLRSQQAELAEIKEIRELNERILRDMLQQLPALTQGKDFETIRPAMVEKWERVREQSEPAEPMSREEAVRFLSQRFADELIDWDLWTVAHLLRQLSPDAWDRLRAGEFLSFSSQQSNSPVRTDALEWWRKQELAEVAFAKQRPPTADLTPEDIAWRENRARSADEMSITLFMDPDTGRLTSKLAVRGGQKSWTRLGKEWPVLSDLQLALAIQRYTLGSKLPALPDEPLLRKPLVLPTDEVSTQDVFNILGYQLAQVAKANDIPLVAELYPFYPPARRGPIPLNVQSWQQIHSQVAPLGYRIRTQDDWVLVSHNDRAFARFYDIPQARLRRWFYKPRAWGLLNLDDCAEIAFLLKDQIEALSRRLNYKTQDGRIKWWSLGANNRALTAIPGDPTVRYALRMYALLTPPQRQTLLQGGALPLSSLAMAQRQSMDRLVEVLQALHPEEAASLQLDDSGAPEEAVLAIRINVSPFEFLDLPQEVWQKYPNPEAQQNLPQKERAKYTKRLRKETARFVIQSGEEAVETGAVEFLIPVAEKAPRRTKTR